MNGRLQALRDAGVSVWLDDLSRERLDDGSLAAMVEEFGVSGVTTNPTIFAASLLHDHERGDEVRDFGDLEPGEVIMRLAAADVARACDLFAPLYAATAGLDGRVSIEVEPGLAHDTAGTVRQALLLHRLVGRENVLVKIPATPEGLAAIMETIGHGLSINVTLIFSVDRYRQVVDAYRAGLRIAAGRDLDLARIRLVASFFISRIDVEVDRRLRALGRHDLVGQAGIANARVALGAFEDALESPRLGRLADQGAHPQRLLWASTGTKDPSYPDTLYVDGLVADGVVNTMPEKTLRAFADHGVVGFPLEGTAEEGEATLRRISEAGVDLAGVFARLEREGVDKFVGSWRQLVHEVALIQGAREHA